LWLKFHCFGSRRARGFCDRDMVRGVPSRVLFTSKSQDDTTFFRAALTSHLERIMHVIPSNRQFVHVWPRARTSQRTFLSYGQYLLNGKMKANVPLVACYTSLPRTPPNDSSLGSCFSLGRNIMAFLRYLSLVRFGSG